MCRTREWRDVVQELTSTERYSVGPRGYPIRHWCSAYLIPEGDHTSDGLPTVLTEPAVSSFVTVARPKPYPVKSVIYMTRRECTCACRGLTFVGCTRILVTEAIARQHGRCAIRVRKREDGSKKVNVIRRLASQCIPVLSRQRSAYIEDDCGVERTLSVSWFVTKTLALSPDTHPIPSRFCKLDRSPPENAFFRAAA